MKSLHEEAIAQMVMSKLNENTITNGQTIDVAVVDGDVFLLGWCDSEEQKIAAMQIARGTYGVRGVVDNIRVRRIVPAI